MKVKMCGLYRPEDIDYANEVQPDYVGFVFYEKSHRAVTKEQAAEYRKKLLPGIQTVGVFVNEDPKNIIELLEEGILDVAQLHGDETEDERTIFRRRNIGFVFQQYNLIPVINVYENIVLPLRLDGAEIV